MPKLIVADGGQKKAFNISKGRLTLGSGEGDKLKLSGAEPGHAALVIDASGGTLDANAPVTLDGAEQSGEGIEVPFGSKLKIGGAVMMLTADAGADAAKSGSATPAGARKKPAAGAARSGGSRAGSGRSSSARGRSSARRGADDEAGTPRRGRGRQQEKQGLPGWAIPTIVVMLILGVGGAWMAFGGGGSVDAKFVAAQEGLDDGNFTKTERNLAEIDPTKLNAERRRRYNELSEEVELRREVQRLTPRRNAGYKWIGSNLESFAATFIDSKPQIPASRARMFLERVETFKARWPEHTGPVWTEDQTGQQKLDFIKDRVSKYEAVVRTSDPLTYEDVAWAQEYYVPSDNYKKLIPRIEAFLASGPDDFDRNSAEALLAESRAAEKQFVAEELQAAATAYASYEAGEETFPVTAASKLSRIIRRVDDGASRGDAVSRFLGLPGIDEILKAYDKSQNETWLEIQGETLIAAKWEMVQSDMESESAE